ncbi:MAG TPA: TonB family protein [Thermoanaerobaculia bacterium]|nr:TonB family protein [Thermoanaerobaculia bacterium]
MPETILVVEYEPRYTDRVRQALAGQPITATFARDGEEAARALADGVPRLVVLSSVIPKGNAADLIRAIRGQSANTAILLTVSGYSGHSPVQDAMRFGASDILPKPYSESEFLGKIQQMLGGPVAPSQAPLTSDEIFGDIVGEKAPAAAPQRKGASATGDIDKLLADTLGGVMAKRGATSPGAVPKPKSGAGFDKHVQDTLSGLEKRKTPSGGTAVPKAGSGEPAPAREAPRAALTPAPSMPDRVLVSQPVFPKEAAASPAEEAEPADGIRFGQYVLQEKIATGGMAEVWKARKRGEEGFQKIVAIKKILPHLSDNQDFIEMFIDEAKLAAQLNHNNIIHIYDLGKIQSSYFIAMEYVDGHDLKSILRRGQDHGQPLGVELSLFVASKIAAALDYAHRKRDFEQQEMGLVHRDVSPQNVLISQEGDIKLCDFGIAKAASKASHTQAGALKGKLQYMSPEQAWGRAIDRRSDIFALAAVLFEMLTGKKLFTGDNEISILEQVREARVVPPSQIDEEIPPEIDAIVLKALQKDPANRYQTAAEMAKDIDSVLYTFKPTPTSADLAIYMHRIWSAEPAPPSVHEESTVIGELPHVPQPAAAALPPARAVPAAPKPATVPGVAMPAWEASHASTRKKRSAAVPLTIAALLVAGIAGAFLYLRGLPTPSLPAGPADVRSAAADGTDPAPLPPPAETGTLVAVPTQTTNTIPPALEPAPAAPPPLDPAMVDQEVQRLLAAERARLEQQARQRQQTATVAPPPRVPPPQVATQPVTPAVPQPAPVVPAPVPVPVPATPPAETAAAEAPPAAPPAVETAPAQPRYREGDLVPQDVEGLTPGRVIRLGSVPYPPMARTQRVEGTVLLNVLISERGEVLEVRLLRGVPRPVGLNEAAEQIIRRSTFSAPMLRDGTRVKAWTTVPVKFEL